MRAMMSYFNEMREKVKTEWNRYVCYRYRWTIKNLSITCQEFFFFTCSNMLQFIEGLFAWPINRDTSHIVWLFFLFCIYFSLFTVFFIWWAIQLLIFFQTISQDNFLFSSYSEPNVGMIRKNTIVIADNNPGAQLNAWMEQAYQDSWGITWENSIFCWNLWLFMIYCWYVCLF